MKKKVSVIIFIIYILIALFSTVALLARNEHGVFEVKNSYYICDEIIKEYDGSSLVRFAKNVDYEKYVEEEVYYYNKENKLSYSKVESYDKEKDLFTIDGKTYEKSFILGKPDKAYQIIGSIINILTSRAIYFVFVIIPILGLFIYEIYLFVEYVSHNKDGKDNDKNAKKKDK